MRAVAAMGLVGLLLGLVACGDDDSDTTTTTASSTTTTTAASATSSTSSSSSSEQDLPDEPPLRDDDVSGSGCTPGSEALADGWWYGTIEGPPTDTLRFDLACYYRGAAAESEAAARGDEVNNDYYVVNDNPQVRTVPVADDATASCVQLGSGVESVTCDPGEVAGDWAVWIRVQGGRIDRLVEQYAP